MKSRLPLILLLGGVAAFAFGIVRLFELRFAAGDVYPPYSSLRADPLGTMAFYESLGKIAGIDVRRDFSTSDRLPEEPGTTYLHLAARTYDWVGLPADSFHEIKNFLARGGRLVIAFYPQTTPGYDFWPDNEDFTNSVKSAPLKLNGTNAPARPAKRSSVREETGVNIEAEWGFHKGFAKLEPDGGNYAPIPVAKQTALPLPRTLAWHSGMIFTNGDSAWRTIYARGKDAVVIERKFGKGSVVLASDSFFVSNEAMVKDRHPDLLAWLVGANDHVVFDEAHLGISESPGVAELMRKYRLQGLAAGLLLLAGLFVWKNSNSLVPLPADESREDFVTGKDAGSGFVNLLRRNISRRDIFAVCFAEWKKSVTPSGQFSSARLQRAEAIFNAEAARPPKDRNPIAACQQISETLGKRKPKL